MTLTKSDAFSIIKLIIIFIKIPLINLDCWWNENTSNCQFVGKNSKNPKITCRSNSHSGNDESPWFCWISVPNIYSIFNSKIILGVIWHQPPAFKVFNFVYWKINWAFCPRIGFHTIINITVKCSQMKMIENWSSNPRKNLHYLFSLMFDPNLLLKIWFIFSVGFPEPQEFMRRNLTRNRK